MTLQFTETTPGIHMAMWEHPKSGAYRPVIIIESLGVFTLYIDGDVAASELTTYEDAATRAEMVLATANSGRMVMIAGALVLIACVGGISVGLSKMIAAPLDGATVAVASAKPVSRLDTAPVPAPIRVSRTAQRVVPETVVASQYAEAEDRVSPNIPVPVTGKVEVPVIKKSVLAPAAIDANRQIDVNRSTRVFSATQPALADPSRRLVNEDLIPKSEIIDPYEPNPSYRLR